MTKTKIMGILNVTPDSCYDGGRYNTLERALVHAVQMEEEGADLIDIGGESTRPGAEPVSVEEELARVVPVIEALRDNLSTPLSIDTMKPEVAEKALSLGVSLLNDVTGFQNPTMRQVAAQSDADLCVMHMQGEPRSMQDNPHYPEGIIPHLLDWFEQRLEELQCDGISSDRIILDPGIGFGKTVAHNVEILQNLPKIKGLACRLLIGLSRKSFMMKITGKGREALLPPTLALNGLLMMQEVDFIRVHDVQEHRLCMEVLSQFKSLDCPMAI